MDFEAQVSRVLKELHTDVVFKVNFMSCASLAIEDVLGTALSDERAEQIIEAVRARLRWEMAHEEAHRLQILDLHKSYGLAEGHMEHSILEKKP